MTIQIALTRMTVRPGAYLRLNQCWHCLGVAIFQQNAEHLVVFLETGHSHNKVIPEGEKSAKSIRFAGRDQFLGLERKV